MNVDQILDLLDDSDLEFEDNDDYDADPSFTLPNQHGNNILYESSDSELELDAVEAKQLETGRQVSVNEGNENGSIFEKVKWRIQSFTSKIFSEKIPKILPVGTPMEYLKKYFPEELYELAALCTNQYYMENTGKILKTTSIEMKQFFGIHVIIGCIEFPRLRMYWSAKFRYDPVASIMPRDRFFQLRVNLHFANLVSDELKKNNKLWKVQPLIDFVRNRCLSIERSSTYYSIDEQMIPFLGRCQIRQFVKVKPRPVGLKNFVITTSDGLIIDFEIYQGLTTPYPDKSLGLGPAVILRLINTIPEGSSVFFDRYFTTIPLMKKLVQLKIHGTGTIQMNRLQKFQFKADSKMKRGDFEEVVSDDKNISMLKWKDNKSVVTTSTCYGGLPTTTVSRWDKTQKKYIDVKIPNMISKYNEKMGGVDHFDQMMEYYRTWLKTRKWPLKVILHLLDLSVTNSWFEYLEDCKINKLPKKKIKDLLQFRLEIGECLTMATPPPPTCQDTEEDGEPPIKIRPPAPIPGDDVRLDGYHHWPRAMDLKAPLSCRYKGCTNRSTVMCTKCKTFLCMSKGKMCFENYHQLK